MQKSDLDGRSEKAKRRLAYKEESEEWGERRCERAASRATTYRRALVRGRR